MREITFIKDVGLNGILDIALMSTIIYALLVWFKRSKAAFVLSLQVTLKRVGTSGRHQAGERAFFPPFEIENGWKRAGGSARRRELREHGLRLDQHRDGAVGRAEIEADGASRGKVDPLHVSFRISPRRRNAAGKYFARKSWRRGFFAVGHEKTTSRSRAGSLSDRFPTRCPCTRRSTLRSGSAGQSGRA